MKKTFIAITLMLAAVTAGAQTMYDGLTFSQNNYYGTARSMGMGNAMTAVGGDLGSVGINPAGSAVYNYSQFTITPNVTMSSMNASWSAYPVNGTDTYTGQVNKTLSRFTMPNIGATINFNTGRKRGLKGVTYGFVVNSVNNYTGQMMTGGKNDMTSYQSSIAVAADGYDIDFLNGYLDASGGSIDDWKHPYQNADDRGYYAPWNVITNAQAGSIANYGDVNDPDYYYRYIAATEGFTQTSDKDQYGNYIYDIFLGGPLNQSFGKKVTGGKTDAILNLGFNFNDKFFLGFNLGITSLNYDYDEYFKEAAVDPSDFRIDYDEATTYFTDYRTRYSYSADGAGVYGKIGFIAIPVEGLRIGAAIQTPTTLFIDEIWRHSTDVNYQNSSYNGNATSPEGNFSYRLATPYRANAGLAYTFMGMGLLSVDYEMTDYSTMKFKDRSGGWSETFDDVNRDIASCMGVSHSVRVGAEIKPIPEFAIRAGYNFTTTPEYDGSVTLNDKLHILSAGVGYSSKGSFFADLAARYSAFSDEYISPYADYLSDVASPMILNKRDRYDITATIGWRF
ncbi:MAG: TonB-dependent receptor [Bacteroidales bacterium]|nr:TonB-dependent receptor [Bacteroidales bacterium]